MTLLEVENLIAAGIEESNELEYKAGAAITNKDEITKDVSAMANANGGTIIYGMKEHAEKEKRHLPEMIDPIKVTEHNKEYLEQVINSGIRPRLLNVVVSPIEVRPGEFVYVVIVPLGQTAHQANDFRYYRRYNFEVLRMYDHEIRDIMNRQKNPLVSVEFKIVPIGHGEFEIQVHLRNKGEVLARFVRCIYEIPDFYMPVVARTGEPIFENEADFVRFEKTNDQVIHPKSTIKLSSHTLDAKIVKAVQTNQFFRQNTPEPLRILWKVYADNAGQMSGSQTFREIYSGSI